MLPFFQGATTLSMGNRALAVLNCAHKCRLVVYSVRFSSKRNRLKDMFVCLGAGGGVEQTTATHELPSMPVSDPTG